MSNNSSLYLRTSAQTVAILAGVALTSCVAPRPTAPVELQASNPSVTYQYHNDQELLQANQNAAAFCSQYQAVPQTARFADGPDGRAVVFECIQGGVPVGPPQAIMPGPAVVGSVSYDGYYDGYYGTFYDGYWGPDGYFYYSDGVGHPFRRDDAHHFRRDLAPGYRPVRGLGSPHVG
jgi:hypothetical protein